MANRLTYACAGHPQELRTAAKLRERGADMDQRCLTQKQMKELFKQTVMRDHFKGTVGVSALHRLERHGFDMIKSTPLDHMHLIGNLIKRLLELVAGDRYKNVMPAKRANATEAQIAHDELQKEWCSDENGKEVCGCNCTLTSPDLAT